MAALGRGDEAIAAFHCNERRNVELASKKKKVNRKQPRERGESTLLLLLKSGAEWLVFGAMRETGRAHMHKDPAATLSIQCPHVNRSLYHGSHAFSDGILLVIRMVWSTRQSYTRALPTLSPSRFFLASHCCMRESAVGGLVAV